MMKLPRNQHEFLALLVRRKWWIGIPSVALSMLAGVLIYVLPSVYVSQVLILVTPRDVPEAYVVDLVGGSSQERLAQIERTVLSRTNLLRVIRKFEDRLPELESLNPDQQVERLGSQIDINFETGLSGRDTVVSSLRLDYQNRDAGLAQEIARDLTDLFIREDQAMRESRVAGTVEFLEDRLEEVAAELAASDQEIVSLRTSNLFTLPAQLDSNQRTLDQLVLQGQSNGEAIDRWSQTVLSLQQRLSEIPERLPIGEVASLPQDPRVSDYRAARNRYETLLVRYTSEHPAVREALLNMQRLEAELPPDALAEVGEDTGNADALAEVLNPEYQTIRDQLRDAQAELGIRQNQRALLEAEVEKYRGFVTRTPSTEQALAEPLRRNEDLRERYDDLQADLEAARLSQELELRQQGEQFRVVDPANLPLVPTRPDKRMLLLGGILGSLVFGVGIGVTIDVARQKVWTQSEIEEVWGVPVLAEIPEIVTDSDYAHLRKRRLTMAASSIAAATAYGVCLYLVYINHDMLLERLDPILRRLVY
jgi:polysaccharide chain length determinant protein (PEP-CTERM system associated)